MQRLHDNDDADARAALAERTQAAAEAYTKAFIAACSAKDQNIYHHIMLHHVADLIRAHGIRADFSEQQLEQLHQQDKRHATNGHGGTVTIDAEGNKVNLHQ